jgi:hypothetical protein
LSQEFKTSYEQNQRLLYSGSSFTVYMLAFRKRDLDGSTAVVATISKETVELFSDMQERDNTVNLSLQNQHSVVPNDLTHFTQTVHVPDRRCRILKVVLVRRWATWVLGIWRGRVRGRVEKGEVSLQAT